MDTERFDQIATAFSRIRTRRETLRLVGAALVGAGGLAVAAGPASAAHKTARKKGHHHHHPHGGGGGGVCLNLGDTCATDFDCCSGKCSTEVITTCRKLDCVEVGHCAVDTDCCGGYCVGGCCQGVCG